MTRQGVLYLLSGLVFVFAWLVSGGVFDDPEPLLHATPLALLGLGLFAWGHVP